jgi:pilus assembly protein CpaB
MRTIRLLTILSMVFSVVVGVLVYTHIANTEQRLLSQLQPTKILIATADIDPGTQRGDLVALTREIYLPARSYPAGAIATTTDLPANYVALTQIVSGSFIFADSFGEPTRLVGGLVVPKGKVVLSIDLGGQERVGRFVRPGATVAVYSTDRDGQSAMIVTSAQVLAIGDDTSAQATSKESALVTLALAPDDAKRVLTANRAGSIQLALLGPGAVSAPTTGP